MTEQLTAAKLWCRLTNALIAKYKPMAEKSPEKAIQELYRIEGILVANGFLLSEDLEKAV